MSVLYESLTAIQHWILLAQYGKSSKKLGFSSNMRYCVSNIIHFCRDVVSEETNEVMNHEVTVESTKSMPNGGVLNGFSGPGLADSLIFRAENHMMQILAKNLMLAHAKAAT